MRDRAMCQHGGVKSPAGCDSLGKLVLPGWCNHLSSNTTHFPPTRSHHVVLLGHLLPPLGFAGPVTCVCELGKSNEKPLGKELVEKPM